MTATYTFDVFSSLDGFGISGNVLAGSWRQVIVVDHRASHDQVRVLAGAFQGRLGGPLGDLAGLVGERLGEFPAAVDHPTGWRPGDDPRWRQSAGCHCAVPQRLRHHDHLRDSIFSTILGSPAWAAKASEFSVNLPEHGLVWSFSNSNAIQGDFKFEH